MHKATNDTWRELIRNEEVDTIVLPDTSRYHDIVDDGWTPTRDLVRNVPALGSALPAGCEFSDEEYRFIYLYGEKIAGSSPPKWQYLCTAEQVRHAPGRSIQSLDLIRAAARERSRDAEPPVELNIPGVRGDEVATLVDDIASRIRRPSETTTP